MRVQCSNVALHAHEKIASWPQGLKVQSIFRFFFVYLTSRASDTLKVETDYLTFGDLITTSDTPMGSQAKLLQWRNIYLNFMQQLLWCSFPSSKIHVLNLNRPTTKPI